MGCLTLHSPDPPSVRGGAPITAQVDKGCDLLDIQRCFVIGGVLQPTGQARLFLNVIFQRYTLICVVDYSVGLAGGWTRR